MDISRADDTDPRLGVLISSQDRIANPVPPIPQMGSDDCWIAISPLQQLLRLEFGTAIVPAKHLSSQIADWKKRNHKLLPRSSTFFWPTAVSPNSSADSSNEHNARIDLGTKEFDELLIAKPDFTPPILCLSSAAGDFRFSFESKLAIPASCVLWLTDSIRELAMSFICEFLPKSSVAQYRNEVSNAIARLLEQSWNHLQTLDDRVT